MRIPLIESDLLILKKAVKLIRKQLVNSPKHSELLDTVSVWFGYFDYKQLVRLLIEVNTQLNKTELHRIESEAFRWLHNNQIEEDRANNIVDSLKFKKLSSFHTIPNNLLVQNNDTKDYIGTLKNYTNELHEQERNLATVSSNPKVHLDEFSRVSHSLYPSKQGDSVINAIAVSGSIRSEWWVPGCSSSVSQPTVVILDKLIPLAEEILNEPQFGHNKCRDWDNKTKETFKSRVESMWPMAMISAYEAVKSVELRIKPFGFEVLYALDEKTGREVYLLGNRALGAYLPNVWYSIENATNAMAQLLIAAYEQISPDEKLSNTLLVDPINDKIKITENKEEYSVVRLDQLNFDVHVSKTIQEREVLSNLDYFNLRNANIEIERSPFYGSIKNERSLSPWLTDCARNRINTAFEKYSRTLTKAFELLNQFNTGPIIELIKAYVIENYDEQWSEYLDIDEPEKLKDSFPALFKVPEFNENILDNWHYDCATFTGFPRKTCGSICVDQSEMIGFAFFNSITGEECKSKHDRDVGVVLAAYCLVNQLTDVNVIKNEFNLLKRSVEELNRLSFDINETEQNLREFKSEKRTITSGVKRTTALDFRKMSSFKLTDRDSLFVN